MILLGVNTLVACLLIIAGSLVDRSGNGVHYIGRAWACLNLWLAGTRLRLVGGQRLDRRRPYVVMSNHQSLFDVWAIYAKLPLQIRWIVKAEIRRIPVFGYTLHRMGHIFVDRKSWSDARQGLARSVQRIREGATVVIFPEGTRSRDGVLLPFRRGGAGIAFRSGASVLPLTINGSRFVAPPDSLTLRPGRIELVVGEPIDPGAYAAAQPAQLMDDVRRAIAANLDPAYGGPGTGARPPDP